MNAEGIGLDEIRRRNAGVEGLPDNFLSLRLIDVLGKSLNRFGQSLAQIASIRFQRRFIIPIHPARQPHFAQHHFGMGDKVFVERKSFVAVVGIIRHRFPCRAVRQLTGPEFTEHHDVGGDFCAGVFLEGIVGQPDRTEQLRPGTQQLTQGRIEFIQRAMRGDEHYQSTGPHLLQIGGEEIIVNGKFVFVPARVVDGVIAEGHIGNGQIEGIVRKFRLFKWLLANIGVGIKRPGDAGGQRINFDTGDG